MKYCPKCKSDLDIKVIDGKKRFCCTNSTCGYIYWNNPIPVVGILVETNKGIVLAHNVNSPPNIFSIITGFLESNEHPKDAAIRETKEELGLDAIETELLGIFPFSAANQILMAYHIKAKGEIELNEELDKVKIIQRNDLNGYSKTGKFEVQRWLNELNVMVK
jgi:NADH pyrophosphatase NudC (nudix superfamily)